jgi:misacylated tRNA(Ala) deacylase
MELEAIIDWDRRYLHMRMHTGLHLLGSILRFGVTGGQIAADRSRLDFDTQEDIDPHRVNAALQDLVSADHPVSCRWITDEELDRQPCGGTYVRSAGEVGRLVVTRVENKGRHNKRVYVRFG